MGQQINFNLWDQDYGGDDSLGSVKNIPVSEFTVPSNGKPLDHTFPVSTKDVLNAGQDETGSLSISTKWLLLVDDFPADSVPNEIYLVAKIDYAHRLPAGFTPPFVLSISVTSDPKCLTTSKPSWPAPAAAVSSVLADIIINLHHDKNIAVMDIADVTDLTMEDVEVVLEQKNNPGKAAKLMMQAAKSRAETKPQFQCALHLLLPWNDRIKRETPITLTLLDKKGKVVDTSSKITFGEIIDRGVKNSFEYVHLDKGTEMAATFHVRWVMPA